MECWISTAGVKITLGHWLKTDQFSKITAYFLVWSCIFSDQGGWVYTVVCICVVNVTEITTFWVVGKGGYAWTRTLTRTQGIYITIFIPAAVHGSLRLQTGATILFQNLFISACAVDK